MSDVTRETDERPDEAFDLICQGIRQETPDAKSCTFARPGNLPLSFEAGQFLNLTFSINGERVTRSYSMSSTAANPGRVAITVKRVPGGRASNWLFDHMRVGDRVTAEGPLGAFTATDVDGPIAFLSAGSGITPIASMIRSHIDLCEDRDIAVLHFARTSEDMIFAAEFAHWARALPRARIIPVVTQPSRMSGWTGPVGRISEELVAALVPDIGTRTIFSCGPGGFMERVRTIVSALGIPKDRLVEEYFTASALPDEGSITSSGQVFDIQFAKSGKTVSCPAEMTVLQSAQAAKINLPTSCGQGVCGTCRVKIVSGTVDMHHGGGIKQREINQGYILACCSKPTSGLVIDR